jgi:Fungal Zn(2)-Cys(6) binuclear cluster domain
MHHLFYGVRCAINHSTSVSYSYKHGSMPSSLSSQHCALGLTLKRHGYYCRSLRADGIARARSCLSCANAKARCDHKSPECSRCINKSMICQYPKVNANPTRPRTQRKERKVLEQPESLLSSRAGSLSVHTGQESEQNDFGFDGGLVMPDLNSTNLPGDLFDWNDSNLGYVDFLNLQTIDGNTQHPSTISSSWAPHLSFSSGSTIPLEQAISSLNPSIFQSPATYMVRKILQRPKVNVERQGTANLMLSTLKSYPLMMLRYNTLPPFIHPRLLSSDFGSDMEPLTNCISLVHMISSKVYGSRKLFWKMVRLECERVCQEVR